MNNSELGLEEFLALNKKESIEQSCNFFQVDYRKSWSKKKMAEALAEAIRKDPLKLFFALPEEGLRFLASLFRKRGSMEIDPLKQTYKPKDNAEFLDTLDLLTLFGLLRLSKPSTETPVVRISAPYELKKIMTPFLTKEQRQFSESIDMMADIVRGLLYYYGVMEMETLVGMMRDKVPSFPGELCRAVVRVRAPLGGRVRFQEVEGKEYVLGFDAVDMAIGTERNFVEKLVRILEERTDLEYKTFSPEALLEAAQDVFLENEEEYESLLHELWDYFIVDGSYMDEDGNDITFLTEQLSEEADFQFFMDGLVQDMRRTGDVKRILQALDENMDFPTKKVRDRMFVHFITFTDTLSRFEFKGYSSLEMESLGKRIKAKVIPFRKDSKVGRNDPCPCGSGKKYKNCHGSGQNPLN